MTVVFVESRVITGASNMNELRTRVDKKSKKIKIKYSNEEDQVEGEKNVVVLI